MNKLVQRLAILAAVTMLFIGPTMEYARASQNSIVLSTTSPYAGITMLNNANSAFNTLVTNNSGGSAPGTIYQYQFWYDTANALLKWTPDGSTWIPVSSYTGSQWQSLSSGIPTTCPTTGGSANAYTLTYSPVPAAYVTGQRYCFKASFANTGAATLNVNGLGAKNLTKRGATALGTGDLGSGAEVECIYDGTQCQVTSLLSSASSGTVTSVGTSGILTGGPITSSGTIAMASATDKTVTSNISGGSAAPVNNLFTSVLDAVFGTTQGAILYRNASTWVTLGPGTAGQLLQTGGAGANPSYTGTLANGTVATTQSPGDNTTKVATTAFVAAAAPGLPSAFGIGSYVMAIGPTTTYNPGDTETGSNLTVMKFSVSNPAGSAASGVNTADTLTGTWRCMQTLSGSNSIGLWLRIS